LTANAFGSTWTRDKLRALQKYLLFYTQALAAQPSPNAPFKLVYIDAFAGTGRCRIKDGQGSTTDIPGSASIALDLVRPFKHYHFIEPKQRHIQELRTLVANHPQRSRCHIHEGTVATSLPEILRKYDWRSHRGVLFLDPFGLQCDWSLLEEIHRTQALDVFFLLSVSGLFRQAPIDASAIDKSKEAALTRVFGTDSWHEAWYKSEQHDLFSNPQISRTPGWQEIVSFATNRLRELFPVVLDPLLLASKGGPPLFALYLLVSNPSRPAKELAMRVGRDILSSLR
jgi:three-Cys-motif partner protein